MSDRQPRTGLLLGDPAGVGPELVARLLAADRLPDNVSVVLIGAAEVFARGCELAGVAPELATVSSPDELADVTRPVLLAVVPVDLNAVPVGQVSMAAGAYALASLAAAVDLVRAGFIHGFTYASLNKQAMHAAGNPHPDELHMLTGAFGVTGVTREINVIEDTGGRRLWISRATSHVPLARVAGLITADAVTSIIDLTVRTLRAGGVEYPRLLVAALNPHAGDGGLIGREEIEIIAPAIEACRSAGVDVRGPIPADAVFAQARGGTDGGADAVVTMYHDQGGIGMKLLANDFGITVLAGLPVPVTTPSHGTAFDIVGTGAARPAALAAAVETCAAMVQS